MNKDLPPLYVWKGEQKIRYDTLSETEKSHIKDTVTNIWTSATNQHIQTLMKKPKTTKV